MSLDLMVLLKNRLSKEQLATLDEFLKKRRFVKEIIGSSFYYYYGGESACVDLYISRALTREDGDYWREARRDGCGLDFLPRAAIHMESRHAKASHLKSYSLAKKMAAVFGGVIYDPQMCTVYNHRGKPLREPIPNGMSLGYGAAIDVFVGAVAEVIQRLQGDVKKKRRSKSNASTPSTRKRKNG